MGLDNDARGWIMAAVSGIGRSSVADLYLFEGSGLTLGYSLYGWR